MLKSWAAWTFAAYLILWEEGLLNFSSNIQASFSMISSLIQFFPFFLCCLLVLKEKYRCRREWAKRIYCRILPNLFWAIRIFKQGFCMLFSVNMVTVKHIFKLRWMWVWKARKSVSNLHFLWLISSGITLFPSNITVLLFIADQWCQYRPNMTITFWILLYTFHSESVFLIKVLV